MAKDEPVDEATADVGRTDGPPEPSLPDASSPDSPPESAPAGRFRRPSWSVRPGSAAAAADAGDLEDAPIGSIGLGTVAPSQSGDGPSWPAQTWTASQGDYRLTAPDDAVGDQGPTDEAGAEADGETASPSGRALLRRPAVVAAGAIGGVMVLAIALVLGPLRPSSATAVLPAPHTPHPTTDPATTRDPGIAAAKAFLAQIVDPTFTYRMVWTGRTNGPGERSSFKATYDVAGRDHAGSMAVARNGTTKVIVKGPAVYMKRGSRGWTRITSGLENLRQYPFLGIARSVDMAYIGPVDRTGKAIVAGTEGSASPGSAAAGTPDPVGSEAAAPAPPASAATAASASPGATKPPPEVFYLLRSTGSYRPNRERLLNMSYLRWPTNRILLEVIVRVDGTPVSAKFRLEAGGTTGRGKPQFVGTGSWTFTRVGDPIVIKAPGG